MTLETGIFYGLGGLLLILSLLVVTTRNLFRGALALSTALGVMAGLFVLLGGDFLAAGQLLIYVGGVMVLILFVVMFVQTPALFRAPQTNRRWIPALVLGAGVAAVFIHIFYTVPMPEETLAPAAPTSAALGKLLLGDMAVPFEVVSLILLAALVGALVFGLEREL